MALLQGDINVVSASLRSNGVKMNDKTLPTAKGLAMQGECCFQSLKEKKLGISKKDLGISGKVYVHTAKCICLCNNTHGGQLSKLGILRLCSETRFVIKHGVCKLSSWTGQPVRFCLHFSSSRIILPQDLQLEIHITLNNLYLHAGYRTWFLRLAQKVLHWLSHLHNPQIWVLLPSVISQSWKISIF